MTTIPIPLINYSEFSTLANCEQQWRYGYIEMQEDEGEHRGMHLGTLLHLGGGRWQAGEGATLPREWTDDINTGGKPGEVRTLRLTDFDPEVVELAEWLLERYMQCYGSQPPSSWNVISAEEWLSRDFGGGRGKWTLVGRSDGAVEIDGRIWLLERKSYKSKGRLDYAGVDPQLGCYSLLFEKKYGERPFGIIYDGIYTYQWAIKKPTQAELIAERVASLPAEAPPGGDAFDTWTRKAQTEWAREAVAQHPGVQQHGPEESFERRFIDLGDGHLEAARTYLASAIRRRRVLQRRPSDAIPNVGRHCSWCGFKNKCWDALGGLDDDEELEYDDAE